MEVFAQKMFCSRFRYLERAGYLVEDPSVSALKRHVLLLRFDSSLRASWRVHDNNTHDVSKDVVDDPVHRAQRDGRIHGPADDMRMSTNTAGRDTTYNHVMTVSRTSNPRQTIIDIYINHANIKTSTAYK